jgi:hypothetical protein
MTTIDGHTGPIRLRETERDGSRAIVATVPSGADLIVFPGRNADRAMVLKVLRAVAAHDKRRDVFEAFLA